MNKEKKITKKDVLSWAKRAEFETGDLWQSIRIHLSDPKAGDNSIIVHEPAGKARRLVLVANLILFILVGTLAAGIAGLIKLPFSWNQGRSHAPSLLPRPTIGFAAIAAGANHMVALRQDGTVIAAGDDRYGQCDVSTWTEIASIYASDDQTFGIRKDGTVIAVGKDQGVLDGQTTHPGHLLVGSWKDISLVAAGPTHTIGLRWDGTVIGMGDNSMRQIDTGKWTDVIDIAAGTFHTLGLKKDGTVVGLGFGFDPSVISKWTDMVMIRAAGLWSIGLRANGTVEVDGAIGAEHDLYVEGVSSWRDISMISAGPATIAGLKNDGTVVVEIGSEVVDVSSWPQMVSVAAGTAFVLALDEQGDIYIAGPGAAAYMEDFNRLKAGYRSPAISPSADISPTTTPPAIQTTPTPHGVQPTPPKSACEIAIAFLTKTDSSIQSVANSAGSQKILLPTGFDVVIGGEEIGEIMRQLNGRSMQNGLDFSGYMGQELDICTVTIDGSTWVQVALLVADTEVVGYWNIADTREIEGDYDAQYRLLTNPGEKRAIYMTSGRSVLYPHAHRIERYQSGMTQQWDRITPSALPSDLNTLDLVGDTEIVRSPEQVTGAQSYTLYDDQAAIVYENSRLFRAPTESGEYILCLEMSWGTAYRYETFQYHFKIRKP